MCRRCPLPGVSTSQSDLVGGLDVGVDFVALSFVREAKDIQQLRRLFPALPTSRSSSPRLRINWR